MARTKVVAALEVMTVGDSSSAPTLEIGSPTSPLGDPDAAASDESHVGGTGLADDESMDLSRYVLIFGNFINLPDVATLSENFRYLFAPPKGDHSWKGGLTGEARSTLLALEFGKNIYSPEGWIIGSSSDSDQCDMQLTADREKLGISRRHLRVDVDEESKCPRITLLSSQNPLLIIVHEKKGDRKLILTTRKSITVEESVAVTINFGTSSFQAWRPTLASLDERTRYGQRCETLFREYVDSVPTFPSLRTLSGTETSTVRFGQNGAVYKRDEMGNIGKGSHATVHRVMEVNSHKIYAAKEPHYKSSDLPSKTLERINRLVAEHKKLVELKHPHIVEPVELLLIENNRHLPPWLIMEYIEQSLEDALYYMRGPASLIILPHIFDAVAFMHSKNYVHRDIKPSNILIRWVNKRPVAKFADVGTMKEDEDLKTFAGTPVYMAPECWFETPQYSKEVDMWSIGLVLLQLFTNWDPKNDKAWVSGQCGKTNRLGFPVWIRDVLMPFVATAEPKAVQELLRGLLCESPKDRWSGSRCQTWVRGNITPPIDGSSEAGALTRRDFHLQEAGLDDENDRRRKIRSPHPTLDSVGAAQASKVNPDNNLPDTLPWGATYVPESKDDDGDGDGEASGLGKLRVAH